jgi:hypothetical protein
VQRARAVVGLGSPGEKAGRERGVSGGHSAHGGGAVGQTWRQGCDESVGMAAPG